MLNGVCTPVGGAEVEKHPDAAFRITGTLTEVLIEAVSYHPRAVLAGGLHGHEQFRGMPLDYLLEKRTGRAWSGHRSLADFCV